MISILIKQGKIKINRISDPGFQFLKQYGEVHELIDVIQYVSFLREKASIGDSDIPVNLDKIYEAFQMQRPVIRDLGDSRGFFQPDFDIVLVNSKDQSTRQRFTEAHELIERYVNLQKKGYLHLGREYGNFHLPAKEWLCNRGAAELLMPAKLIKRDLDTRGVSLATGRYVARKYHVSLTSALIKMVNHAEETYLLISWQYRNKPSDEKQFSKKGQITYFRSSTISGPQKQLRIRWGTGSPGVSFIPKNKSIPNDSSVYSAWEANESNEAAENLFITKQLSGRAKFENLPFLSGRELHVLSLIHIIEQSKNRSNQLTYFKHSGIISPTSKY